MRFCLTGDLNVTVADIKLVRTGLISFDEEQKKFVGAAAEIALETYMLKKKKETQQEFLKNCNFKIANDYGQLLPNNTYGAGAFSQIISNAADFLFRKQTMFVDSELIDFSDIMAADNIYVGHFIDEMKTKEINAYQVLNQFVPSNELFLEFIFLMIFSFVIGWKLFALSVKKASLEFYFANFFRLRNTFIERPRSSLSFLFLSNLIFMFLIKLLTSSNIKVTKVIVDQENLLYSEQKIYSTNLKPCFIEKGSLVTYFERSLKDSLAYFIFYNKTESNEISSYQTREVCLVDHNGIIMTTLRDFFLIAKSFHMVMLRLLSNIYKKDIFINRIPLFSMNAAIYISKKINAKLKKSINKWTFDYLSGGFDFKFIRDVEELLRQKTSSKSMIYYSGKEYVDKNSMIDPLKYERFKYFFQIYILILIGLTISKIVLIVAGNSFKFKFLNFKKLRRYLRKEDASKRVTFSR